MGAKWAFSRRSRASSTRPWVAASSSTTSMLPGPFGANSTHDGHSPHGSGVGPFSQFSDRARIRALEVLPHPRGPENRYAWCTRSFASARVSGPVTWSCPTTSANRPGRYVRYKASEDTTGTLVRRSDETMVALGPSLVPRSGSSLLQKGPLAHPVEPTCPCCLPALGEFSGVPPREGSRTQCTDGRHVSPIRGPGALTRPTVRSVPRFRQRRAARIPSAAEDSPSGLWRTLGKRVGGNPSRVRIPHPPPPPHQAFRIPGVILHRGPKPCLSRLWSQFWSHFHSPVG